MNAGVDNPFHLYLHIILIYLLNALLLPFPIILCTFVVMFTTYNMVLMDAVIETKYYYLNPITCLFALFDHILDLLQILSDNIHNILQNSLALLSIKREVNQECECANTVKFCTFSAMAMIMRNKYDGFLVWHIKVGEMNSFDKVFIYFDNRLVHPQIEQSY
jgi:hypothetical protein